MKFSKRISFQLLLAASAVFAFNPNLHATEGDTIPPCRGYGYDLPVNNSQVLHWKRTTENQFRERAHVQGPILQLFSIGDRDHVHFEIQLGKYSDETLEVIYNQDFGKLPPIHPGMQVEACGDYITSTAPSGPYPASPVGAIIHWIHMNPNNSKHDAGFLVIDGKLYGQDIEHVPPRRSDR